MLKVMVLLWRFLPVTRSTAFTAALYLSSYDVDVNTLLRSLLFFVLAGFLEIGGGYLIWLWLREQKPLYLGLLGAVALALYGIVATFQPTTFGRVYAAYGGVFIVMAISWGWFIDGVRPDRFDLLGALIALLGVLVIMYAPRS